MWKKVCIAALTVCVGLLVVSPKMRSFVRVKFNRATNWANKQVSPETKIEALRLRLADLAREDERHYDTVARQELELKKRETRVASLKTDVERQEARLKLMTTTLEGTEAGQVSWNGSRYDRDYFKGELRNEYKAFQAHEKVLKSEQRILETMRKTVAVNKQKLREMELARSEMQSRLTDLERQLAEERLARNGNLPVLNDADYTRLNKDIDELTDDLEVQKRSRELRGQRDSGSLKARDEEKARQDQIDRDIQSRFGQPAAPVASGR